MAMNGKMVFGRVKDTATTVANSAADVANSMVKSAGDKMELAKIANEINDQKKLIKKLYRVIGEKVYESKSDVIERSAVADDIAAVDAAVAAIEELVERSAKLRGFVLCPACGRECPETDTFCSKCGAKLPEKQAEEPAAEPAAGQETENK